MGKTPKALYTFLLQLKIHFLENFEAQNENENFVFAKKFHRWTKLDNPYIDPTSPNNQ
jgi:hypothetical protein